MMTIRVSSRFIRKTLLGFMTEKNPQAKLNIFSRISAHNLKTVQGDFLSSTTNTTDVSLPPVKAGNLENEKRKPFLTYLDDLLIIPGFKTQQEWQTLEEISKKKRFPFSVFEEHIMDSCNKHTNYQAAKSFVEFVESSNRKLSSRTLAILIRLNVKARNFIDENIILDIYQKLMDTKECLNRNVISNIVLGLCSTSKWKKCLDLLEENRRISSTELYSMVYEAAWKEKDMLAAYHVLTKMASVNMLPSTKMCVRWFDECAIQRRKTSSLQGNDSAKKFLDYLRKYSIYVSVEVAEKIDQFYHSDDYCEWYRKFVHIPESGICPHCNSKLESSELGKEEFEMIRKHFIHRIYNREDRHYRILPNELQDFKQFLKTSYPFEYVVDGYNVASYQQIKSQFGMWTDQLCDLIKPFVNFKKKNVLVIASNAMQSWKGEQFRFFKKKCHFYFTKSKSTDALLLTASLYGGPEVYVLSRHLLSTYKFNMKNSSVDSLLKQWLFSRQLYFEKLVEGEDLKILTPLSHNPVVQYDSLSIHIPCTDKSDPVIEYNLPTRWLCLKKLHDHHQNRNSKLKALP